MVQKINSVPLALRAAVAGAGFALLAIPFAQAQVLTITNPPVMVNQGDSYRTATDGMQLQPGDSIMVMEGGSAQVTFPNRCVTSLGANDVLPVDSGELCQAAAQNGNGNGGNGGNSGTGSTGSGAAGGTGGGVFAGISNTTLLIGGVAAAGGIYVATDDDDDDDDISR